MLRDCETRQKRNCSLLRCFNIKKSNPRICSDDLIGVTTIQIQSDEELKQLEHVLEVVRHNHQKLDETFVNVFGNMTYSQHVYINLNVLLYKTCHKLIERHVRISYMNNDQDKLKKMLRIYFTLKQLIENTLRNIENVQHRPRLEMENFCDWFGVEILKAWFNQVAREAKILIRNNIEKNYVNILSQPVISGLPTKHLNNIIFNKVIRFWKELDWPDVKAIEIMINCLNDCILEYYERMLRKIKKEHIPPYKRKINVSNEMRLIVNNMTEITKCIENVIEVIERDLTNKLATESRKYLTGPLRNIIAKAKSEMLSCSKHTIQSAKLQAYELIQNIINSKPGKMKQNAFCTFEKFIDDFVKLLIHNLTKMGVKFVIYEIWNEILKNLHESLDEHKSKGVADVREILSMIVAKLSDKEDILTHNQMKNFKYNRLKSDFLELDYTKMN
ncbi:protein unc-13 homolog 4B-like isoform X2 [Centruroides vittatus]|uniref:protein unc-13 homolog 4B-like isoform X2 n=1 Tax=Centruroides vittatus TaxID=120091 RepID=UPI0035105F22